MCQNLVRVCVEIYGHLLNLLQFKDFLVAKVIAIVF